MNAAIKIFIFTSDQMHFMMTIILLFFGGILLVLVRCLLQLKQKEKISSSNESTKIDLNKTCHPETYFCERYVQFQINYFKIRYLF